MKKIGMLVTIVFLGVIIMNTVSADTLSVSISSGNDDAEERLSSGSMYITSSDLELTRDSSREQEVGMRFTNIQIPQAANINSAFIQFTVDEVDTETTNLVFHGHDTDDAPSFSSTAFDITSRTKTSASVAWNNVPAWTTVNVAGPDQKTPDLTSIIQEVVNRPGWVSGNDIVIIVTGSGQRTAESYNGGGISKSPKLDVEWQLVLDNSTPSVPQNLAAVSIAETTVDLTWDASSDPESGIDHYNVFRDNTIIAQTTTTSFSGTGLTSGTNYTYEVSAVNGANLESARSTAILVTTQMDINPPTIVSVLNSGRDTLNVTFDEEVDQSTAEDPSNYQINNGVSVINAVKVNPTQVVLITTDHGKYTLTVNNVEDLGGNPTVNGQKDYSLLGCFLT